MKHTGFVIISTHCHSNYTATHRGVCWSACQRASLYDAWNKDITLNLLQIKSPTSTSKLLQIVITFKNADWVDALLHTFISAILHALTNACLYEAKTAHGLKVLCHRYQTSKEKKSDCANKLGEQVKTWKEKKFSIATQQTHMNITQHHGRIVTTPTGFHHDILTWPYAIILLNA